MNTAEKQKIVNTIMSTNQMWSMTNMDKSHDKKDYKLHAYPKHIDKYQKLSGESAFISCSDAVILYNFISNNRVFDKITIITYDKLPSSPAFEFIESKHTELEVKYTKNTLIVNININKYFQLNKIYIYDTCNLSKKYPEVVSAPAPHLALPLTPVPAPAPAPAPAETKEEVEFKQLVNLADRLIVEALTEKPLNIDFNSNKFNIAYTEILNVINNAHKISNSPKLIIDSVINLWARYCNIKLNEGQTTELIINLIKDKKYSTNNNIHDWYNRNKVIIHNIHGTEYLNNWSGLLDHFLEYNNTIKTALWQYNTSGHPSFSAIARRGSVISGPPFGPVPQPVPQPVPALPPVPAPQPVPALPPAPQPGPQPQPQPGPGPGPQPQPKPPLASPSLPSTLPPELEDQNVIFVTHENQMRCFLNRYFKFDKSIEELKHNPTIRVKKNPDGGCPCESIDIKNQFKINDGSVFLLTIKDNMVNISMIYHGIDIKENYFTITNNRGLIFSKDKKRTVLSFPVKEISLSTFCDLPDTCNSHRSSIINIYIIINYTRNDTIDPIYEFIKTQLKLSPVNYLFTAYELKSVRSLDYIVHKQNKNQLNHINHINLPNPIHVTMLPCSKDKKNKTCYDEIKFDNNYHTKKAYVDKCDNAGILNGKDVIKLYEELGMLKENSTEHRNKLSEITKILEIPKIGHAMHHDCRVLPQSLIIVKWDKYNKFNKSQTINKNCKNSNFLRFILEEIISQPVPPPVPQSVPPPVPQSVPVPVPVPQPVPQPAPQPAPQPVPQPVPQPLVWNQVQHQVNKNKSMNKVTNVALNALPLECQTNMTNDKYKYETVMSYNCILNLFDKKYKDRLIDSMKMLKLENYNHANILIDIDAIIEFINNDKFDDAKTKFMEKFKDENNNITMYIVSGGYYNKYLKYKYKYLEMKSKLSSK